jgi:N-methylhydantoinase A/oxoprolinase/acetone carboxylase beta subunit
VSSRRIAAGLGGTFTDVLSVDESGGVRFSNVLSTPPGYDQVVVRAVAMLELDGAERHGAAA